jgi:hypothetical protein
MRGILGALTGLIMGILIVKGFEILPIYGFFICYLLTGLGFLVGMME